MRCLPPLLRASLAEVVGSSLYYFCAAALVIEKYATHGQVSEIGNALAHGMVLTVLISGLSPISGAHFNPAITFTFLITRRVDLRTALAYWIAQLTAAGLAALAIHAFFPPADWQPVHAGATYLRPGVSASNGLFVEVLLTFLLVLAIFSTTLDPRHHRIAGFGVGLIVFTDILVGGARSGASMNPARSLASALASNYWQNHWVYWLGPFVGASICGLLYMAVFWPRAEELASSAEMQPESSAA